MNSAGITWTRGTTLTLNLQGGLVGTIEKTEEAARIVKVSKSFLHHHWKEIPAALKAGRHLRWDMDRLKNWMRENAENSNGGAKEE